MRPHESRAPAAALLLFIFAFGGLLYYYVTTVRPLLEQYVESELRNRVNLMVSRIVEDEIARSGVEYASLIHVEKDREGRILSLTTDVTAMNTLKTRIESSILEGLLEEQLQSVRVPLGSLMGSEFLSGRGPCISIRVVPIAEVAVQYDNSFASAGINQTRHQIYLRYELSVQMLLPGQRKGTCISSQVCIAETVIVGAVPQFFAGAQQ